MRRGEGGREEGEEEKRIHPEQQQQHEARRQAIGALGDPHRRGRLHRGVDGGWHHRWGPPDPLAVGNSN